MYRPLSTLALVLTLTACSGGGGDTTTTTTTGGGGTGNEAPVVATTNTDKTGQVGYEFSYDATQGGATFTDADGDTLTYTCNYSPAANGLSDTGGVITGVPSASGDIDVTITATDGNGGTVSNTFTVAVTIDQTALSTVFAGEIDLDNLRNYANQPVPNYINELNEGGNPITDAGATLGRVLFYDTALSITDTFSCASCHTQDTAFSDTNIVSAGVEGGATGRHSMRMVNTQFARETRFFWDERAASHEAQETQPIQDQNELGFSGQGGRPNLAALITKLEGLEYYEELFRFTFLDPEITEERLQIAMAQFTKSIFSFDSRFDDGLAASGNVNNNFGNFTATENAGKNLFLSGPGQGGAGCNACHRAPEFDIAPNSGSNGVVGVVNSTDFDFTVTRSPTLRDLVDPNGTPNGPFMHDASLATLREVIDHYDQIVAPAGEPERTQFLNALDNRLQRGGGGGLQNLNLTEAEKTQLEAFLRTLTGQNMYTDTKLADPFP